MRENSDRTKPRVDQDPPVVPLTGGWFRQQSLEHTKCWMDCLEDLLLGDWGRLFVLMSAGTCSSECLRSRRVPRGGLGFCLRRSDHEDLREDCSDSKQWSLWVV